MMTAHTFTDRSAMRPWPGPFARLMDVLGAARARRTAMRALVAMSDSELADMSISRSDVTRLFDPDCAQEYKTRRAARGTHLRPDIR